MEYFLRLFRTRGQDTSNAWLYEQGVVGENSSSEKVTFLASKKRLWVKGEISGNTLHFVSAELGYDNDTIRFKPIQLILYHTGAKPALDDKNIHFILEYTFCHD